MKLKELKVIVDEVMANFENADELDVVIDLDVGDEIVPANVVGVECAGDVGISSSTGFVFLIGPGGL